VPSLGLVVLGDSNNDSGETLSSGVDDVTDSRIKMIKADLSTAVATETLLNAAHAGMSPGRVGSALAMLRLAYASGKVPTAFDDVYIIPAAWAGTAFTGFWSVTGTRFALDGGNGLTHGLYDRINAFLALNSANRIWAFDWMFGANCAGESFQTEALAMWSEIRSRVSGGAARAPIFLTGVPPDRIDANLGNQTNLGGVLSDIASFATWQDNGTLISSAGLRSYLDNGFVHYSASAHRGGTDNSSTVNTGYSTNSWYWSSGMTKGTQGTWGQALVAGDHVLGSDNWCYKFLGGNINSDPTTDGGANWLKTSYQYGLNVTDSLATRKLSALSAAKFPMRASWT